MLNRIDFLYLRFNLLNKREKLLTVGAFILVLWSVWENLLNQRLQQDTMEMALQISALQAQISTEEQLLAQMASLSRESPASMIREQLTQLQLAQQSLKQRLGGSGKQFVPANLMPNALTDILKQQGHLKLIKLETLPVSSFENLEQGPPLMYRHSMVINLQGDFFSTLDYLQALEALPWRIQWQNIRYQVKDYPLAETRIEVYTLSFEKEWLGV